MASSPLLSRRHLIMGSVAAALSAQWASAQGTPSATAPGSVVWQPIGSDDLPRNGIARLSHIVLAPGEELPRYVVPHQAVFLVVGGTVEASANSESFVAIREGTRASIFRFGLPTGSGVILGPRSNITMTNPSDTGAALLLLDIVLREDLATPGPATTPEVDSPVRQIAAAPVTFPTHRGGIFLEQRVEDAGTSAVSSTWRGVEIGEIAAGSSTLLITRGSVRVTSPDGAMERTGERGERLTLTSGDRYACADGSLVWRAGAEEPLVVRRAQVVPSLVPG